MSAALPRPLLLPGIVAALWLLLALGASDGLYTIDELIQVIGTEALLDHGTLVVANGYDILGAEALRLSFLRDGPHGLVPQYPSGLQILAAPLHAALGVRGLILLNALAAIGSLVLCHALALRLFEDRRLAGMAAAILGLATFVVEYAAGVWPHALSMLFVLGTAWCGIEAVRGRPERDLRYALAAGLIAGAGLLIRIDAVLIVPPLAAWTIVYAVRPIRLLVVAGLGMLPGLAVSTALNWWKFGVLLPFSYGIDGGSGNTSLTSYVSIGVLLAVALVGCVLLRSGRWRLPLLLAGIAGVVALAAAAALLPALQAALLRLVHGLYILVIDLTAILDTRPQFERFADGTMSFWGVSKKALVQSLPWLGLLPVLALRRRAPEERAGLVLCLLVVALWILPFARSGWHGGLSANMRYFLPILPVLAILVALAWRDIRARADLDRSMRLLLIAAGAALAVLLVVLLALQLDEGVWRWAQQRGTLWLAGALALAALAAGALPARPGRLAARLAAVLFALSLGAAFVIAWGFDLAASQGRRIYMDRLAERYVAELPGDSLVYGWNIEAFAFQVRRDDAWLAKPDNDRVDRDLIAAALARGKRVFVQSSEVIERMAVDHPELRTEVFLEGRTGWDTVWEITAAPPPAR